MNCKPGDLAIVIRSSRGVSVGKVVQCIRPLIGYVFQNLGSADAWLTEPMLKGGPYDQETPCPDAWLRPIRDPGDDATDETLLWLPAPKQTEAA